jgi:beta-glucanase (GH16 family)
MMSRGLLYTVLSSAAGLLAAVACASSSGVGQSSGTNTSGNATSGGSSGGRGGGSGSTSTGVGGGTGVSGTADATTGSAAMTGSGSAGSGGDAGTASGSVDAAPIADASAPAGWVLWWSDEFNGATGMPPNPQYWGYELGGGGWGLGQLQTYTNSTANAATDGKGNLAIVAIQDTQGNFTSARLKTQGKIEHAYGRFETRAKVLSGNGMWPAFWTLGNNFPGVAWPQCGEIDIMEMIGSQPYTNGGSLHGPGYSGMYPLTASYSLPDGGPTLADDFHTYAVEWETGVVRFYVDDNLYETRTPADIPIDAGGPAHWVYDHPFFILLNLGVGGRHAGPPTGTVFPQSLLVDYVRIYVRPDGGA